MKAECSDDDDAREVGMSLTESEQPPFMKKSHYG